jgi:hypothetical protein
MPQSAGKSSSSHHWASKGPTNASCDKQRPGHTVRPFCLRLHQATDRKSFLQLPFQRQDPEKIHFETFTPAGFGFSAEYYFLISPRVYPAYLTVLIERQTIGNLRQDFVDALRRQPASPKQLMFFASVSAPTVKNQISSAAKQACRNRR